MDNNNKNNSKNIRTDKFIYTEEDMAGITIIKKNVVEFMELVDKLHKSDDPGNVLEEIVYRVMNELCINAGGNKFRVIECEVYYDDKTKHQDPFLYGHHKQNKKLNWYFHYSGVDLTIGDGDEIKGGILIRSILDLGSDVIISGPLKSSNCILNATHCEIFASKADQGILFLEPYEYKDKDETIEKSLRIGLDKGKILNELTSPEDSIFHNRDYRYVLQSYSVNKKCVEDALRNKKRIGLIIKESQNDPR